MKPGGIVKRLELVQTERCQGPSRISGLVDGGVVMHDEDAVIGELDI